MKHKLLILIFLIVPIIGNYSQINVDYLGDGYFEVEYGCITESSTYEIDFMGFKVEGLTEDLVYEISQTTATIFDEIDYQSKSSFFDPISNYYWKWTHPSLTTDTIILEASGYYQNLEIGSSQGFLFRVAYGYDWDMSSIAINVESSMSISGPYLDCSNPVTFNLLDMPSSYASASWTIKQNSITKASGTGTTASANNLTDGKGEVTFTISFSCGLESLSIKKDFWFGKPVPSIVGPDEVECYSPEWYFINDESYQWGDYLWSTDYNMEILSTTTGHKAEIQGLDEGYGQIFLEVTNDCGSNENRLVVYVNCSRFLLSPNPASESVQVTVTNTNATNMTVDDKTFDVFKINIYDLNGVQFYSDIKTGLPFSFPVNNFKNGNYIVKIYDGKKTTSLPLIVKH
jgi:hypothetical protein